MIKRTIYEVYGADAKAMTRMLLEKANIAEEIPAGASVGLKPNLVVGKPPESGATTHGGILEGILAYLQDHGIRDISIMEGSWIGERTERGFAACGYEAIARKYGVPLYDLKKDKTRAVETPIGELQICCRPLDTGYLISLPVLKGHCQTGITCAMKNSKGCLPDAEKRHFHALGLHRPIAALAAVLRPALYIVDSLCGDLNFEEGGTPVQTNRMLLGHDPVQLDTYGCMLMGIDPESVAYIGLAQAWGAGSTALAPEDILRLNDPADAPAFPKPSGLVSRLTRGVEQRAACSACLGNLVHALYRLESERHQTYRKPIYIGQGFAGQATAGLGVGKCCAGAARCVMGCPPAAEDILQALLDDLAE